MFEQDYVMRLIREMIRTLLKLMFNIDTESPARDLLNGTEEQHILNNLYNKIDQGNINDAEDELFRMLSDDNGDKLKMALLFYSYLNDKSDVFLEEHHFSRKEIQQGIRDLVTLYNLSGIEETFLTDL